MSSHIFSYFKYLVATVDKGVICSKRYLQCDQSGNGDHTSRF